MKLIPFKKKKPHKTREGKIVLTMQAHAIDVVIDIGANEGQTYEGLRKSGFKGRIVSVEPIPALQDRLQTMAAKDPLWDVLPPLAIGEKNGTSLLNVSHASDLSSTLTPSSALMEALPKAHITQQVEVSMKTLDTLLEDLHLDGKKIFVKIDTQGNEMVILQNAPVALETITGLQVELSLFELYEGEVLYEDVLAYLQNKGFIPHMLIETNFSRKLNRQLQIDGVFYKD